MKKINPVNFAALVGRSYGLNVQGKLEMLVKNSNKQLATLCQEKGMTIDEYGWLTSVCRLIVSNLHFKGAQIRLHSSEDKNDDSYLFATYKTRLGDVMLCKSSLRRCFGYVPTQIFVEVIK